jgi:hypothetical protein
MVDKHRDAEHLPPIPDGGLSGSMPDWLQRPPAWRAVDDDEPAQLNHDHPDALLRTDTSMIDPRTLLTEDDLPPWLRGFPRSAGPAQEGAKRQERDAEAEGVAVANRAGTSSRFVPRSIMPVSPALDEPAVRKEPPARGRPSPASSRRGIRWQDLQLVLLLLAGALLVAMLVIVLLLI